MSHTANRFDGRGRLIIDRVLLVVVILLPVASHAMSVITTYGWFGVQDASSTLVEIDFAPFWVASKTVLDGHASWLYDIDLFIAQQRQLLGPQAGGHGYLYPPQSILLIWPLGLLSYGWSLAAWLLIGFVLYLCATFAGAWRWFKVAALTLAPATFANAMFGQNGFVTAALLIGGMRLLERAPIAAGILFGLLTFKPQLGVLVPVALIAAGAWRAFAAAVVTTLVLMGLTAGLFGMDIWSSYIDFISGFKTALMERGAGIGYGKGTSPTMMAQMMGLGPVAGSVIQALFSLGAAGAVYWAFRPPRGGPLAIAVLAVVATLATPMAYVYDMTIVSVAVILIYDVASRDRFLPGESAALALAWLSPLLILALTPRGWPVGPVLLSVLLVYVLTRLARFGRAGAPNAATSEGSSGSQATTYSASP